MPFDFKKEYKEFYLPKNKPQIVNVPKANYIAIRGQGNPKQKFESEHEALTFIKKHKMYKYTAYVCKVCGKYHIGIKK